MQLIFINNLSYFLGNECSECFKSGPNNLLKLYLEFIEDNLLPTLRKLLNKFSIWWTFKPDSLLKDYLEINSFTLSTYFRPEELFDVIVEFAKTRNMIDLGNSQIIILDQKLQECFKLWVLFIPDLFLLCQDHVNIVSADQNRILQNMSITQEMCIEVPDNIIFNDPSSQFWLNPDINAIINFNNPSIKVTYSWAELNALFLNFCTTNKEHFTRIQESIIQVNYSSPLAKILPFKFFNTSQIEEILKKSTLFLGKSNTLKNVCPKLHLTIDNFQCFNTLDYSINVLNKYLPYNYSSMSI